MYTLLKKTTALLGLYLLLTTTYGQEQPFLRVRYAVDYRPVADARVQLFAANDSLLGTGKTDATGRYVPELSLQQADYIVLTHPDFVAVRVAGERLITQRYEAFFRERSYELKEVVFTANKFKEDKSDIPARIEVIDAAAIRLRNPATSASLLEQSGAVFVQRSQMGGGSPVLRGFEANKVLLVIDGVRMNNAIYRGGHLQNAITLDPNMVDRAEVLFGPASVMYGSDALGGVMHFYSRDPQLASGDSLRVGANLMARYASANQEKTMHADVSIGSQRFGSLTSLTWSDFDDLRSGNRRRAAYPDFGKRELYAARIAGTDSMLRNEEVNVQRFSGYSQYDFLQKFLFLPNNHLSHKLNLQYSRSGDIPRYDRLSEIRDGRLRYSEWNYGPQTRLLTSYQLRHEKETATYDQLSLVAAFQDLSESRINRRFGNDNRQTREERVQVYSINLDANKELAKKHELAYGLEAVWNAVESVAQTDNIRTGEVSPLDTRYPDGGSVMGSLAAYLTDRWEISDAWILTAGARYTRVYLKSQFANKSFFPFLDDQIEQHAGAFSGNAGLVYRAARGWRLSALAATGFRAPNVDDIGKTFDSSPGNVIVPNPQAKPEYTYNAEMTIRKQFGKRAHVEATGFYTRYTDALVVRNFTVSDGRDSLLYDGVMSRVQAVVNAGRAFVSGVNLSAHIPLHRAWSLDQTLTYTHGQDLSADVPLDHIPPLFGRLSLNYAARRIQAELFSQFNGWKHLDRYSPSGEDNLVYATPEGMPAWWTLNLRSTYAVGAHLSLQLQMENILDQHYRVFASGISAPGRNLILAVRAGF